MEKGPRSILTKQSIVSLDIYIHVLLQFRLLSILLDLNRNLDRNVSW